MTAIVPLTAPRAAAVPSEQSWAATSYLPVLVVLDTSGSMAQPLDGTSPMRKIDIVLQMALSGWSAWPPGMATGLMTFNATNDASERTMINTVVPLMRTDSSAWVKASIPVAAVMWGGSPTVSSGSSTAYLGIRDKSIMAYLW